jgi:hypothetical protein
MLERPVRPGPELEARPSTGLPYGSRELRPLLDERLVDDHQDLFAGLETSGFDQIPAPATHLLAHARILAIAPSDCPNSLGPSGKLEETTSN